LFAGDHSLFDDDDGGAAPCEFVGRRYCRHAAAEDDDISRFRRSWCWPTRPTGGDIDGSLKQEEKAASLERETLSRISKGLPSAYRKLGGFGGIFEFTGISSVFCCATAATTKNRASSPVKVKSLFIPSPAGIRALLGSALGGKGDSHGKIQLDPTGFLRTDIGEIKDADLDALHALSLSVGGRIVPRTGRSSRYGMGIVAHDAIGRRARLGHVVRFRARLHSFGMVITSPEIAGLGTGRWIDWEHVDRRGPVRGRLASSATRSAKTALRLARFPHRGGRLSMQRRGGSLPPVEPLPAGTLLRSVDETDLGK